MFPKRLVARRVLGAAEFVSAIVRRNVSPKSGPRHKGFATSRSVTNIIADGGMGAFDVMVEMGHSKKSLVAVVKCAVENTFVVVRS